jgi:predicted ATP-grasp superfamily ATP-dependent carboligase
VLVVAVSARMLAQLAVAEGYEVVALDRFGDADLRAIASVQTATSAETLVALAASVQADAVVYGAGLENRPDLVARLAVGRELLGTPPELLEAVRDPWAVGEAAQAAGARAPQTLPPSALSTHAGATASTPGAGPWLRKPRRGGGGRGVRHWTGGRLRATEILQRHVDGLACSAVAVGDGRSAVVLGLTEQLHRPRGYAWTGNATPPRLAPDELAALAAQLRKVCEEVVARFGVRGAFSVDAVWDGRHAWVLEVNPRPTAGLELFGPGTFALHVRGARGGPLATTSRALPLARARTKLVLFADRDVRAPRLQWWPSGLVRDIPRPDEEIARGQPVCTLLSATAGPEALAAEGARLLAALPEAIGALA